MREKLLSHTMILYVVLIYTYLIIADKNEIHITYQTPYKFIQRHYFARLAQIQRLLPLKNSALPEDESEARAGFPVKTAMTSRPYFTWYTSFLTHWLELPRFIFIRCVDDRFEVSRYTFILRWFIGEIVRATLNPLTVFTVSGQICVLL